MNAEDQQQANAKQGRLIRLLLMTLPIGTVLLGIASFGIWMWKKDRVEERAFQYASALRQPISLSTMQRHLAVLGALPGEGVARLNAIAGYAESTTGPENMGYQSRRVFVDGSKDAVSAVDVELTGKQKPRDVVLLLVMPGGQMLAPMEENSAIAGLLTLAHEITGEPTIRTVRMAIVPMPGVLPGWQDATDMLKRLGREAEQRRERITHLITLGPEPAGVDLGAVFQAAQRGTVIKHRAVPLDPAATVPMLKALKQELLQLGNAL
ncbi:MAG: hypothetical protein H7A55_00875 [Verrucomicrobiaceae bacterium]|nr:hypothetical protein [Verrucomicrobiaceae bacterium]